jgi:hypothetical protein
MNVRALNNDEAVVTLFLEIKSDFDTFKVHRAHFITYKMNTARLSYYGT